MPRGCSAKCPTARATSCACAALIVVPEWVAECVADPIGYYEANARKSLSFVRHPHRNGCDLVVFSSSASIYQAENGSSVNEGSPRAPQSPYARTKSCAKRCSPTSRWPGRVCCRCGTSARSAPTPSCAPASSSSAPAALSACSSRPTRKAGRPFPITGTNYPTRDGAGIRDHVHVWDLAAAHVVAIQRFDSILTDTERSTAINLGTGKGITVRELCEAFNAVVSTPLATIDADPRPGEVAGGYIESDRASELLGWTPSCCWWRGSGSPWTGSLSATNDSRTDRPAPAFTLPVDRAAVKAGFEGQQMSHRGGEPGGAPTELRRGVLVGAVGMSRRWRSWRPAVQSASRVPMPPSAHQRAAGARNGGSGAQPYAVPAADRSHSFEGSLTCCPSAPWSES